MFERGESKMIEFENSVYGKGYIWRIAVMKRDVNFWEYTGKNTEQWLY